MFIATLIISVLFAVVLLFSASMKLRKDPEQIKTLKLVGVPEDQVWLLAVAEIAGAVGLIAGLFWWPIGVAAAIGLVLYFVGAVASHLRARDKNFAPAGVLLLVGAAALVLRVASN